MHADVDVNRDQRADFHELMGLEVSRSKDAPVVAVPLRVVPPAPLELVLPFGKAHLDPEDAIPREVSLGCELQC